MNNDNKEKTFKKRGRPRKAAEAGAGGPVLETSAACSGKSDNLCNWNNMGRNKFSKFYQRILAKLSTRFFKMRGAITYISRFRGQFCLMCLLCLYILATDIIPRTAWALDRKMPYVISDVKVESGYPGQMVDFSVVLEEVKPGRLCGVVVNPQAIDQYGTLGFINQTRLFSGVGIAESKKMPDGKILIQTNFQVPVNLKPGVGKFIAPLQIICEDNETHEQRPIHTTIKSDWLITARPVGAPPLTCSGSTK